MLFFMLAISMSVASLLSAPAISPAYGQPRITGAGDQRRARMSSRSSGHMAAELAVLLQVAGEIPPGVEDVITCMTRVHDELPAIHAKLKSRVPENLKTAPRTFKAREEHPLPHRAGRSQWKGRRGRSRSAPVRQQGCLRRESF